MQNAKPVTTQHSPHIQLSSVWCPSTKVEKTSMSHVAYSSTIGSLMFVVVSIRSDIALATGVVNRFMAYFGREHWIAMKWILIYLRGTSDVAIYYGLRNLHIEGFVNVNNGGDLDGGKSISGYTFIVAGGAVSWSSKLQLMVAMSTIEA